MLRTDIKPLSNNIEQDIVDMIFKESFDSLTYESMLSLKYRLSICLKQCAEEVASYNDEGKKKLVDIIRLILKKEEIAKTLINLPNKQSYSQVLALALMSIGIVGCLLGSALSYFGYSAQGTLIFIGSLYFTSQCSPDNILAIFKEIELNAIISNITTQSIELTKYPAVTKAIDISYDVIKELNLDDYVLPTVKHNLRNIIIIDLAKQFASASNSNIKQKENAKLADIIVNKLKKINYEEYVKHDSQLAGLFKAAVSNLPINEEDKISKHKENTRPNSSRLHNLSAVMVNAQEQVSCMIQ